MAEFSAAQQRFSVFRMRVLPRNLPQIENRNTWYHTEFIVTDAQGYNWPGEAGWFSPCNRFVATGHEDGFRLRRSDDLHTIEMCGATLDAVLAHYDAKLRESAPAPKEAHSAPSVDPPSRSQPSSVSRRGAAC
ncbi:MAG: hypothetical protein ACI81R_001915 [Bradymonadia bacterium]|jgi:hypothetical protein